MGFSLVANYTNMSYFHPLEVVGRCSETRFEVGETSEGKGLILVEHMAIYYDIVRYLSKKIDNMQNKKMIKMTINKTAKIIIIIINI